jgi:hypothetical protein
MREGQGTLKELTTLWRQLDARGRWMLVETAYAELQSMKRNPECRSDMPSQAEALKLRQELNEKLYGPNGLEHACSGGKEKGSVPEAEGAA